MKVRHEVDAVTIKPRPKAKRAILVAASVAVIAASTAAPATVGAKARHDAMRPGVTNTR